jgi:hypothetical protein
MNKINYKKLLDDRVKQFPKEIIIKNNKDEYTIITNNNNDEIKSQDDLRIKQDTFKIKMDEYMKRLDEIKKIII